MSKRVFVSLLSFFFAMNLCYAELVRVAGPKFKNECISGNCQDGYGSNRYDDEYYVGEFKWGARNGNGTLHYGPFADSPIQYVGGFRNDCFNGFGTHYYRDGTILYQGEYRSGVREGEGTLYNENGSKFVGHFSNHKYNGRGIMYFANGEKFIGSFLNANYHGYGALYDKYGKILYAGNWINNTLSNQNVSNASEKTEIDGLVAGALFVGGAIALVSELFGNKNQNSSSEATSTSVASTSEGQSFDSSVEYPVYSKFRFLASDKIRDFLGYGSQLYEFEIVDKTELKYQVRLNKGDCYFKYHNGDKMINDELVVGQTFWWAKWHFNSVLGTTFSTKVY